MDSSPPIPSSLATRAYNSVQGFFYDFEYDDAPSPRPFGLSLSEDIMDRCERVDMDLFAVRDPGADPSLPLETKEVVGKMQALVPELSPREQVVICFLYGLWYEPPFTSSGRLFRLPPMPLEEVARVQGLTRERTRQIWSAGLRKLRRMACDNRIV